jgi:hypothetical protein
MLRDFLCELPKVVGPRFFVKAGEGVKVINQRPLIMNRRSKLPGPSGAKALVFVGSGRHG